jgi:hypothetical protein
MKVRIFAALSVLSVVGVLLGGCGGGATLGSIGDDIGNVVSGISLATKSIDNPVSANDLYEIESSISIGFTALKTYKSACINGAADKNCRSNIAAIQVYTRQLPPYLNQLRLFVKNNDQIDAVTVYNQLIALYGNAKATADSLGVSLKS